MRSAATPIARRDLLPVALIGIGQFGLLIALLNVAVLYSSSTRVSLVFATLPLMTIAVSWFVLRTRIDASDIAAIVLTVIGVVILLGGGALAGTVGPSEFGGLGCAVLATLTGAVCSTFYAPYLRSYGILNVSVVAMAGSLVFLGAVALVEPSGAPISAWSLMTLLLVGFVGLSSGVGYLMWLYALANAPAGIVTAFLALSPITAIALSILWLDARATASLFASLVLIVGGLAFMAASAPARKDPL